MINKYPLRIRASNFVENKISRPYDLSKDDAAIYARSYFRFRLLTSGVYTLSVGL